MSYSEFKNFLTQEQKTQLEQYKYQINIFAPELPQSLPPVFYCKVINESIKEVDEDLATELRNTLETRNESINFSTSCSWCGKSKIILMLDCPNCGGSYN